MAEGGTLRTINTVLLVGILVTTTLSTCSNDRLEDQVIRLRTAVESGSFGGGGGGGSGGTEQRVPGAESPFEAVGWGGARARIMYVEGALPDAPLRIADKPRPQNDWYVSGRGSAPRTLNYYATSEGETSTITASILGRLLEINADDPSTVIPELATSWEIADDKLTYTYRLRRGVQFADGRPFTSADVKFSYEVMQDPGVEADHLRSEFIDVESLETPDPYTVVVKYKRKYWKGLYTVGYSLRVLNKAWYEEQIPKYAEKLDEPEFSITPGKPGFGKIFNDIRIPCPGAGPYYLANEDEFTEDYVNLVQNPFYFGTQVHPTWYNFLKLRWIYIADAVASFEAYRRQEFDVTVVDSDRWEDQLSKDPTITNISRYFEYDHMGLGFSFVTWNCRRPPFDDPKVRLAMTHLTNRQWILDELERGKGTIAINPSKRIYPNYRNDLEPHRFDPEKAKALLAEAGWSDTDGDGILDKDGKPFEWEFKVPSGRTFFVRVAGVIKDACQSVGIRMDPVILEWSTFIEDFYEHRFDGVCLYNSFADPWIDPYDSYHSSGDRPRGGNDAGWHSPEVDTLLERMREEFDADKRNALHREFHGIYYDEQPQTLLIHGLVTVLQNNRFEDVKVRPTGLRMFDFWVKPENVLHK